MLVPNGKAELIFERSTLRRSGPRLRASWRHARTGRTWTVVSTGGRWDTNCARQSGSAFRRVASPGLCTTRTRLQAAPATNANGLQLGRSCADLVDSAQP